MKAAGTTELSEKKLISTGLPEEPPSSTNSLVQSLSASASGLGFPGMPGSSTVAIDGANPMMGGSGLFLW